MKFTSSPAIISLLVCSGATNVSAFAPSCTLTTRNSSTNNIKSLSHQLYSTTDETGLSTTKLYEEEYDDAYPKQNLEEIISQIVAASHKVIKDGYPSMNIPSLDPLKIKTISKKIEKEGSNDITFTVNDPVIEGLDTIKLESATIPSLFSKEVEGLPIDLSFSLKNLVLSSDDYDREGSFKLLFKDKDITKLDRKLSISFSDITYDISIKIRIIDGIPKVEPVDGKLDIGSMKAEVEDSRFFNTIVPFFKDILTKSVLKNVDEVIVSLLNDQIPIKSENKLLGQLEDVYKKKQAQGLLVDAEGNEMKPRLMNGLGGLGEVAYPIFWQIPGVPADKLPHIPYSELINTMKTGDIIMFQGVASGALTVRRFTQSPFSHTIMLIKDESIFDGRPCVLQATSGEHYDLFQERPIRGVQINDLKEYLDEYNLDWGAGSEYNPHALCVTRRLNMERSDEEEKHFIQELNTFIKETHGLPYAKDYSMNSLYVAGLAEIDLGDQDDKTFYCASYAARALMKYGIITDEFSHHQYGPRDFSMKYNTFPYVNDSISYGHEIVVDF